MTEINADDTWHIFRMCYRLCCKTKVDRPECNDDETHTELQCKLIVKWAICHVRV
jgi:hypothetical protein